MALSELTRLSALQTRKMHMLKRLVPAFAALALAAPALAADLPSTKSAPYLPVAATYDWTGLYLGFDGGVIWGTGSLNTAGGVVRDRFSNGFYGGYAGYNKQFGNLVIGLEGNVNGVGIKSSAGIPATGGVLTTREGLLASVDGRLGYAFDRTLIYAIGGVAFTDTSHSIGAGYLSDNTTGFDVGGGVEYAIFPNWLLRAEYRYYDFGSKSFPGPLVNVAVVPGTSFSKSDNTFRLGLAYKFGGEPAPVVAKY